MPEEEQEEEEEKSSFFSQLNNFKSHPLLVYYLEYNIFKTPPPYFLYFKNDFLLNVFM